MADLLFLQNHIVSKFDSKKLFFLFKSSFDEGLTNVLSTVEIYRKISEMYEEHAMSDGMVKK